MSDWTPLSFGSGQVLSANQLNNLQGNVEAVRDKHKGGTAPDSPVAGANWLDDSGDPWIWKIYDGTSWLPFAEIDTDDVEARMHNPVVARGDNEVVQFIATTHASSGHELGSRLQLSRTRGTKAAKTAVISGDLLGDIQFTGYNGSLHKASARLVSRASQDWTGAANGTRLEFWTTDDNNVDLIHRGSFHQNGGLEWLAAINCHVGSSGTAAFYAHTYSDNDPATPRLVCRRARGSRSSRVAVNSGNALGELTFSGYNGKPISDGWNPCFNLIAKCAQTFTQSYSGVITECTMVLSGDAALSDIYTISYDGGMTFGAPAGGSKGYGTINAEAVYDDGALLTCYPLEAARTGDIDISVWDRRIPKRPPLVRHRETASGTTVEEKEERPRRTNDRARAFKSRAAMLLDPEQYANFWQTHGHLPAFPHVNSWQALSLGDISQRMWETVETQAVHIAKLTARINSLEAKGGSVVRG